MQFFGDKYGERVRVVQIGGRPGGMDGYSMELCGGTTHRHRRNRALPHRRRIGCGGGVQADRGGGGGRAYQTSGRRPVNCVPGGEGSFAGGRAGEKIENLLARQRSLKRSQNRAPAEAAREAKTLPQRQGDDLRHTGVVENLGPGRRSSPSILEASKGVQRAVSGRSLDGASRWPRRSPPGSPEAQAGKLVQLAPIVGGKGRTPDMPARRAASRKRSRKPCAPWRRPRKLLQSPDEAQTDQNSTGQFSSVEELVESSAADGWLMWTTPTAKTRRFDQWRPKAPRGVGQLHAKHDGLICVPARSNGSSSSASNKCRARPRTSKPISKSASMPPRHHHRHQRATARTIR